jgi:two-component system NtrC family response regulator
MSEILIVDDDPDICETLASLVRRQGHAAQSVRSLSQGYQAMSEKKFDILFLDVRLPDGNGLELLPKVSTLSDPPEVIILTGKGDPDGAELAIKGGVWDYILKPSSVKEITLTLNRALRYRREKQGKGTDDVVLSSNIIGESSVIKATKKQLLQAAKSPSNLLITGETGTGKEVFARSIHEHSSRKNQPFVVVDCASLTESLVESILFGHRKGAFTGAHDHQKGLIKQADGGTLFLDEIGEMPLTMQKAFLRVLQERVFRAVGDAKEQTSNFRLIAATNKDLDRMVEEGTFRSDLLYRIKTMKLHLPPLRLRTGDIRLLAAHRVQQLCERYGIPPKEISSDFYELLEKHYWPGNIRELFNNVERAIVSAGDEKQLYAMHLPSTLRIAVAKQQIEQLAEDEQPPPGEEKPEVRNIRQQLFADLFQNTPPPLKNFRDLTERLYLIALIDRFDGNLPEILRISGLSRSHLYSLLKKHQLNIGAN